MILTPDEMASIKKVEEQGINPYAWVSSVESLPCSAHFRRSSEPSRKGFSFSRIVPTALTTSLLRAAVEKTNTT